MRMLNSVAFYIFSLDGGGAERVTSILANRLAERGAVVTIFTMKPLSGRSYFILPTVRIVTVGTHKKLTNSESSVAFNLKRITVLRSLVKESNPDVLITMMTVANVIGALALLGTGIKCVASERNDPAQAPVSAPWRLLRKFVYGSCYSIVAQTKIAADWLSENTNSKRISVIANPVEFPLRAFEPRVPVPKLSQKIILGVGRLCDQKQFSHLIHVFARLAAERNDWVLVIAGEGKNESDLKEQAHSLGVSSKVMFPGRLGNLADWYQKASLYVMTSAFEGYPNSLIEAMTYCLPVVSYDCPSGPADVIDNYENGILVEPDNQNQLFEVMNELMADQSLANALGEKAGLISCQLHVDRILDQWVRVCSSPN